MRQLSGDRYLRLRETRMSMKGGLAIKYIREALEVAIVPVKALRNAMNRT